MRKFSAVGGLAVTAWRAVAKIIKPAQSTRGTKDL